MSEMNNLTNQNIPEYPFEQKDVNIVASVDGNVKSITGPPSSLNPEEVTSLEGLGTLQRTYTPLNGEEVKKAILKHIEKCLDNSNKFPSHIIMERARWKFMIVADYDAYIEVKVQVKGEAGISSLVEEVKGKDEPAIDVESMDKIHEHVELKEGLDSTNMAPDEVRELTDQDIPVIDSTRRVIKVKASSIKGRKR